MSSEKVIDILESHIECINRWVRCDSACDNNCDACELNYGKGTMGEQREAFHVVLSAYKRIIFGGMNDADI